MSTLTTIQSTDLITNSRANINDNFSALNTDKMETSVLDTDTTLAANSDAKVATQKAVKAYVDGGGNPDITAAQAGGGILGTPSASNKFMTEDGFDATLATKYTDMTYPIVEATSTATANNSSAVSATAPTGTTAGELLVVFLYIASPSVTGEPSGYTKIAGGTTRGIAYAKIATGTDTFTATLSGASDDWVTVSYRISNFWDVSSVANIVTANVNAANAGSTLNPENNYYNRLWITAVGNSNTGYSTAAPTGYGNFISISSTAGDAGESSLGSSYKTARLVEETGGAFTTTGTFTLPYYMTVAVKASETYLLS